MNKALRHEMKMKKYRMRLTALGLKGEHHAYRTTGRPCNCWACRKDKYKRDGQAAAKELQERNQL